MKVFSTKDRIKLVVEDRGLFVCPKCQNEEPARSKCVECFTFGMIPGSEVQDTVTFTLAPFTAARKAEILSMRRIVSGQMVDDHAAQEIAAVRYSVKSVSGLKTEDKNGDLVEWVPPADENGDLTDEAVDMLLNTFVTSALSGTCKGLLGGIPRIVTDARGYPLRNAHIILPGTEK